MPVHEETGFRTRYFCPPVIRCQRWRRWDRGGRRGERGEERRGWGGRGRVKFGKSCQRRAAGVRGKLRCRDLCSSKDYCEEGASDVLAEREPVSTLRWIRSICMIPHSSTQQCLRVWPLRSPSLSQTRAGYTDTGAHTVPPAHTRSRGDGSSGAEQPSARRMTAFPHCPKNRPTERTGRIWGPSIKVSLNFTDRTPSAAGSAGGKQKKNRNLRVRPALLQVDYYPRTL